MQLFKCKIGAHHKPELVGRNPNLWRVETSAVNWQMCLTSCVDLEVR